MRYRPPGANGAQWVTGVLTILILLVLSMVEVCERCAAGVGCCPIASTKALVIRSARERCAVSVGCCPAAEIWGFLRFSCANGAQSITGVQTVNHGTQILRRVSENSAAA